MSFSRYDSGKLLATNQAITRIRDAVKSGAIRTSLQVFQEGDRIDAIAGRYYGDGRLWWVIAAASNIGWWMQVPPGTRIVIPTDINEVVGVV
jgi:nucleoid-associated protein YgaU